MGRYRGRILIIDDSPSLLWLLDALLSAEGFNVHHAADAVAGRELLTVVRPDLVLCEINLGDAAPFAMLDLIDGDETTRGLPVVLWTGRLDLVAHAPHRLCRAQTEVVFKPFDIDHLMECIERSLPSAPNDRAFDAPTPRSAGGGTRVTAGGEDNAA